MVLIAVRRPIVGSSKARAAAADNHSSASASCAILSAGRKIPLLLIEVWCNYKLHNARPAARCARPQARHRRRQGNAWPDQASAHITIDLGAPHRYARCFRQTCFRQRGRQRMVARGLRASSCSRQSRSRVVMNSRRMLLTTPKQRSKIARKAALTGSSHTTSFTPWGSDATVSDIANPPSSC
jgi:hypothetical protein